MAGSLSKWPTISRNISWHFECWYGNKVKYMGSQLRIDTHSRGPLYKHGLTLIPLWIRNHIYSKVWDAIIYPFLNFNGCTVEVWEWISIFIPHFIMIVIAYACWETQEWYDLYMYGYKHKILFLNNDITRFCLNVVFCSVRIDLNCLTSMCV